MRWSLSGNRGSQRGGPGGVDLGVICRWGRKGPNDKKKYCITSEESPMLKRQKSISGKS